MLAHIRNRLILASTLLFGLGLLPDSFLNGFSFFGWLPLFILFLRAESLRQVLLFTGSVSLVISILAYSWLLFINESLFFPALAYSIWFMPVFFALLESTRRLFAQTPGRLFGSICVLWPAYLMVIARFVPLEVYEMQFFSFPLAQLQILSVLPHGYIVLTVLTLAVNAGLAFIIQKPKESGRAGTYFFVTVSVALLFLNFVWGSMRLTQASVIPQTTTVKISAIQHNLPFNGHDHRTAEVYRRLAFEAAMENPDMIIFPLYTLPNKLSKEFLTQNPEHFFEKLSREIKIPILVASRVFDPKIQMNEFLSLFKVSAFLYSADGRLTGSYDSVDRSIIHDKHQVLSNNYMTLDSTIGRLGVLLCYENVRAKWARQAKQQRAQVLVGLSNPADAPQSLLPYYHLRYDRMRAIETGLPLIRVSPNGFTGLISPLGQVLRRSNLRKEEILQLSLQVPQK